MLDTIVYELSENHYFFDKENNKVINIGSAEKSGYEYSQLYTSTIKYKDIKNMLSEISIIIDKLPAEYNEKDVFIPIYDENTQKSAVIVFNKKFNMIKLFNPDNAIDFPEVNGLAQKKGSSYENVKHRLSIDENNSDVTKKSAVHCALYIKSLIIDIDRAQKEYDTVREKVQKIRQNARIRKMINKGESPLLNIVSKTNNANKDLGSRPSDKNLSRDFSEKFETINLGSDVSKQKDATNAIEKSQKIESSDKPKKTRSNPLFVLKCIFITVASALLIYKFRLKIKSTLSSLGFLFPSKTGVPPSSGQSKSP